LFNRTPSEQEQQLDRTIVQLAADMQSMSGDSDEYQKATNQLERLYKLKASNGRKPIDPNTWLLVGGNLAGIVIIVAYEHAHPIASKAMNQLGKFR
jgi:hypothetical protein